MALPEKFPKETVWTTSNPITPESMNIVPIHTFSGLVTGINTKGIPAGTLVAHDEETDSFVLFGCSYVPPVEIRHTDEGWRESLIEILEERYSLIQIGCINCEEWELDKGTGGYLDVMDYLDYPVPRSEMYAHLCSKIYTVDCIRAWK